MYLVLHKKIPSIKMRFLCCFDDSDYSLILFSQFLSQMTPHKIFSVPLCLSAKELVCRLMEVDQMLRITAQDALWHEWYLCMHMLHILALTNSTHAHLYAVCHLWQDCREWCIREESEGWCLCPV